MAHLSFCSSLDDTMANYPHCDCGEKPPPLAGHDGCEYVVALGRMCQKCGHRHTKAVVHPYHERMPKTSKEKQEDYRARMALLGMKEVRGIYLPEALHPVIKEQAAKLLAQHKPEEAK